MKVNIHLWEHQSSWTADIPVNITFNGMGYGSWRLLNTRFVNLLAYEAEGEFVVGYAGDYPYWDFYDGMSSAAAFVLYYAPRYANDQKWIKVTSERLGAIEYPRNPAGVNCCVKWSLVKA